MSLPQRIVGLFGPVDRAPALPVLAFSPFKMVCQSSSEKKARQLGTVVEEQARRAIHYRAGTPGCPIRFRDRCGGEIVSGRLGTRYKRVGPDEVASAEGCTVGFCTG